MKVQMKVGYYPGDTGEFIKVIQEKCNGCGLCALYCTRKVWERTNGKYRPARLKDCAECGACWNVCAPDAIEFSEPRGGTGVRFNYG
jgi:NAD-dependent dihydropyrimidine dehydrogenase PreA subunit